MSRGRTMAQLVFLTMLVLTVWQLRALGFVAHLIETAQPAGGLQEGTLAPGNPLSLEKTIPDSVENAWWSQIQWEMLFLWIGLLLVWWILRLSRKKREAIFELRTHEIPTMGYVMGSVILGVICGVLAAALATAYQPFTTWYS